MLVSDAHSHINPVKGLGPKKVGEKFKQKGGWFIVLVSLPPYHFDFTEASLESYEKSFKLMIEACEVYKSLGLKCALHLGFHPAEVDHYHRNGLSYGEILDLGYKVIDLVAKLVEEGKAHGFGEVGRQHYPTEKKAIEVAESIMRYSIEKARDLNVPVHLHLEQGCSKTVEEIHQIVKMVNAKPEKIVFHHWDPTCLKPVIEKGYWATVTAKKELLKQALKITKHFLTESDYLDDPKRPGAVIVPWSIPKTWRKLLSKGVCNEKDVQQISVENIQKIYGYL